MHINMTTNTKHKIDVRHYCTHAYVHIRTHTHTRVCRWDTAGADRFKGVTTAYFRGAHSKSDLPVNDISRIPKINIDLSVSLSLSPSLCLFLSLLVVVMVAFDLTSVESLYKTE